MKSKEEEKISYPQTCQTEPSSKQESPKRKERNHVSFVEPSISQFSAKKYSKATQKASVDNQERGPTIHHYSSLERDQPRSGKDQHL